MQLINALSLYHFEIYIQVYIPLDAICMISKLLLLLVQDALKAGLEASLILAFDMSCKAMFEQVDATFQKGLIEHTTAAQQHFQSSNSQLALTLRVRFLCIFLSVCKSWLLNTFLFFGQS